MRLAVAATATFGAAVLERLAARHEIEVVLTRPDRPRGRGRRSGAPPVKEAALRLGLPVVQPESLSEAPGTAGIVVVCAYGVLVPAGLLEERLWLNVHPSLLPRWRGAAPVERALMAGDAETGVTIHRTTAELDAGPIAAKQAFPIGPEDDAGVVYERCAGLAVELLDAVLPAPTFTPQSQHGVTYAEKIGPEDRMLDWSAPTPEILDRVRALSPHIGARGEVGGRMLTVWKARRAGSDAGLLVGDVELLEVQPESGRRMTAAAYLRGLRP
ncbi:MAG: methionyl-tRNA formyltransferase [Gaiellales bacterium]